MMMNDNNEGVEVEAPPTFFGRFFGGIEENDELEDSIDQLPDTTVDDIESDWGAPSSSNQRNKQHTCSNVKFFILLLAVFGVFLGIGIGIGRPVGDHIYSNTSTLNSMMEASAVGASDIVSVSDPTTPPASKAAKHTKSEKGDEDRDTPEETTTTSTEPNNPVSSTIPASTSTAVATTTAAVVSIHV